VRLFIFCCLVFIRNIYFKYCRLLKFLSDPAIINNIPIQSGTPTSGQSLVYNSTTNQWTFDQSLTITTVPQVLVQISSPAIVGCGDNESEKWDIYLTGSNNDSYYLQLFFFNNSNVSTGPVFAALYGIKV